MKENLQQNIKEFKQMMNLKKCSSRTKKKGRNRLTHRKLKQKIESMGMKINKHLKI